MAPEQYLQSGVRPTKRYVSVDWSSRGNINPHPSAKLSQFPAHICLFSIEDDRTAHFDLRTQSYEDAGIDLRNATLRDAFDDLPSTVLIGAVIDGSLVGTLRLSIALGITSPELPCEPYLFGSSANKGRLSWTGC